MTDKRCEQDNNEISFVVDTPHRAWLEAAYKSVACVGFKGKVEKISKKPACILFTKLYICLDYNDGGPMDEGCEDHVWIGLNHNDKTGGAKPFLNAHVKVGDFVSFTGDVYIYQRQDKTFDYGIENCRNVEKIDPYELPTEEEMEDQFLNRLICENCLFYDHCNFVFCLAPDGYKAQQLYYLKKFLHKETQNNL